jgi:uncharacterized protein YdiU (UPF0061 family)
MAALDIPTTRALSIVASNHPVYREQVEAGAIMTRVAASHIRFGNFEYFFYQNKHQQVKELADFCLRHYYPHCLEEANPYQAFFSEVVKRTAQLIAKWQAVGFAHGVMNTDNMSILGLTIDYGPFGFLDDYQAGFICNHSDHSGRYAFDQQPSIGLWNLNALAHALSGLIEQGQLVEALSCYQVELESHYYQLMAAKLGLVNGDGKPEISGQAEQKLLGQLLAIMQNQSADYTLTFRQLSTVLIGDSDNLNCQPFLTLFDNPEAIKPWLSHYRNRLEQQSLTETERIKLQNQHNPVVVLRNYLAQQAIDAATTGDYSELKQLLSVLESPYAQLQNGHKYYQAAPLWGKQLEVSCSS